VILLDFSKSLLRQAQERLGDGERYTYVAANLYQMPLADDLVDAAAMVRVIHHLANVPDALRQLNRVIRPQGTLLLEFASKLHLKSLLRYAAGRQSWSPLALEPVEFASLNFDFHPKWIKAKLVACGFEIDRVRTVSRFRIPLLKRVVPAQILARLDGTLQWLGALWQLTPSVFVRAHPGGTANARTAVLDRGNPAAMFRCPRCEASQWQREPAALHCLSCDVRWAIDDGIYDFKDPL
jgi:SAM-dependent methyltransferase